jgi:hypothetical protein
MKQYRIMYYLPKTGAQQLWATIGAPSNQAAQAIFEAMYAGVRPITIQQVCR